jgi:uncharacterized protein involved in tolerance to divalent cations
MSTSEYVVILSTCPNLTEAETIATRLVTDGAAACINIVDHVSSIYRWQEKVERADEVLLVIKTTGKAVDRVEKTIKSLSHYDCPEVIVLPIVAGSEAYLAWLADSTGRSET